MAKKARETTPDPQGFEVAGTTLVHPSRLNPAPYNSTKVTPERLEGLKADIRKFGFVEKLVIQRLSPRFGPMVIVGGHIRLRAVREICIEDNVSLPDLPCSIRDLTDRQAKMLNAALNAERGVPDAKLLAEMLESIHDESPIVDDERIAMGFEQDDLAKLLKLSEPPAVGPAEPPVFARSVTLGLEFGTTEERDAVRDKLVELADAQKKRPGDVVMALLSAKPKRR